MSRMLTIALTGMLLLVTTAWGAEKVIHAQRAKDLEVTLKSESGGWKPGKNNFVLEFTSTKDKKPVDVGKANLNTSMAMTGMAPMIAGATLTPDKTPGRYVGTIEFPDGGTRQVTVTWDGPAGNGSTRFSVPVR
jgi:hypothetical protein